MLSLSESCGRSTEDFHSVLSWKIGAVLERPVCASVLGVTASSSGDGLGAPWAGLGGVLALTDAGWASPWVSGCCDMGSTLGRPSRRRPAGSVADCLADIAGSAPGTAARMRVVWARRKHQLSVERKTAPADGQCAVKVAGREP